MKIGTFVYLNTYLDEDLHGSFVVMQHIKKPKNNFFTKEEILFKVIYSENSDYNVGDTITLYSHEVTEVTNEYDIEKYNRMVIFQ